MTDIQTHPGETTEQSSTPSSPFAQEPLSGLERLAKSLASESETYLPAQAFLAYKSGNFTAAIDACDTFVHRVSLPPLSVYLIKAASLLAMGELDHSAECFHSALSRDPENSVALKGLGDVHFARGAEQVALAYYERAAENALNRSALVCQLGSPVSESLKKFLQTPESDDVNTSTEAKNVSVDEVSDSTNEKPSIEPTESSDKLDLPEILIDESDEASVSEEITEVPSVAETQSVDSEVKAVQKSVTLKREAEPKKIAESETPAIAEIDRIGLSPIYRTETMADLLVRQGYIKEALSIYRELCRHSDLPRIAEKLQSAEEALAAKRGR